MVGKTVGEQLDQSSEMADTKLYLYVVEKNV